MKSLFKLKKYLIISAAVLVPIAGVAVAVPLLTQQYSISNVQQKDMSEIKLSSAEKAVEKKEVEKKDSEKQKVNEIHKNDKNEWTVKWENASIDQVSKELSKLESEKPQPVKPQVSVTIIDKKEEVSKPQKPVDSSKEKTLVEKIFKIIKNVKGDEKPEEITKLKEQIQKVKEEHFKEQSQSK